jgi:hypothetical protein
MTCTVPATNSAPIVMLRVLSGWSTVHTQQLSFDQCLSCPAHSTCTPGGPCICTSGWTMNDQASLCIRNDDHSLNDEYTITFALMPHILGF